MAGPPHARHRRRRHRRLRTALVPGLAAVIVIAIVVAASTSGGSRPPAHPAAGNRTRPPAAPATAPPTTAATYPTADGVGASWVVAENRRPGTSAWQITGTQSATGITGYADRVDASSGQTVTLQVSTTAPTFHVEAYRMGYYQGLGARLIWRSAETPGTAQPPCPVSPGINMVQCSWPVSLTFTLTDSWVQGQYLLKLVGSGGEQSYVPLTVLDLASHAAYVIMAGVLTDQVFNAYGGYDLYQGATPCAPNVYPCSSRSRVVSFDRPYDNSPGNGAGSGGYLYEVYPLTRYAEQQGLDVTYWSDITLSEHGDLLPNHHLLLSPGHDEEWSLPMRTGTVAAAKRRGQPGLPGSQRRPAQGTAPALPHRLRSPGGQLPRPPGRPPLRGRQRPGQPERLEPVPRRTCRLQHPGRRHLHRLRSQLGQATGRLRPVIVAVRRHGPGRRRPPSPGRSRGDMQAYDPSRAQQPRRGWRSSPTRRSTSSGTPPASFADTTYYTSASSHAGVFSSGTTGWIASMADCPPSTAPCPATAIRALTGNLMRIMGSGPSGVDYPAKTNVATFYH